MNKLINDIRKILIADWDPIGVNINPNLKDEYDNYVSEIISLLDVQASIKQISKFLYYLEKEEIGTVTNTNKRNNVAKKLKLLWLHSSNLKMNNIYYDTKD